jgi:phage major head subunit gpT-like protein
MSAAVRETGELATKLPNRRNSPEQNKKIREKAIWNSVEMREFRESIQGRFGFDMRDKKAFPVDDPDFNWGKFKRKVMRETNTASANTQLLRAGVQTAVNNLYGTIDTTYENWAHVVQSSKDTELYAPLNAMTFLGEIGPGEKYIEGSVVGLDIKLRNKKFGEVFPVEFELIEDDQTGQFAQKVSDMTEYAAIAWEVYAYGKLASISAGSTYGPLSVPASETQPSTESTYPWNQSGFVAGGGKTRPSSFGTLTQANVQAGFTALENQLNLQGLKMQIAPDTITIGPKYRWDLATLLNSNFYPSGAQSAGVVGGSLATNVLKGIANPVISRFMFDNNGISSANSSAWYIMDTSRPWFIVQIREAAHVTQENPESGESFNRDILRWKLRIRGNADFIDPRFAWQGSNGSV